MAVTVKASGKDKIFYAKCTTCATELNYKSNDVQEHKKGTPYPAMFYPPRYIVCPECGTEIPIFCLQTESEYKKVSNMAYSLPYGSNNYCCGGIDETDTLFKRR